MRIFARVALALLAAAAPCYSIASTSRPESIRPKYLALPPHSYVRLPLNPGHSQLPQWNGSFTDHLSQTVNFTMVGADPAASNATTRVKVFIIPVKMVFGQNNGNMTFDPLAVTLPGGQSLIDNVLASPLFTKSVKFVQGGTDVGHTQYIDAYQRANFWSSVSTNTKYHVVLYRPTVLPEQTITVKLRQGKVDTNPFGVNPVGEMYVNAFDKQIQAMIAGLPQIGPGALPLFITYDTYLTEAPLEGCCIGGFHSAIGSQPDGQTYAYTTYEDEVGSFAQDVSAMSHELGEWTDDPFVDNDVNCLDNTLMENGDPLENNTNYGAFPYVVNGFTYNLQSLVFLDYFGAPASGPVNGWFSFQNDIAGTCPGQPGAARRAAFSVQ